MEISVTTSLGDDDGLFCIDRLVQHDDVILITGWTYRCDIVQDEKLDLHVDSAWLRYFQRTDVAAGFGFEQSDVRGFLCLGSAKSPNDLTLKSTSGRGYPLDLSSLEPHILDRGLSDELIRDHAALTALLHERFKNHPGWLQALAHVSYKLPISALARGHLESAKGIENVGGLIVGWCINPISNQPFVVSDDGVLTSLDHASRWSRTDIIEAFGPTYGNQCQFAGFIVAQHAPFRRGGRVHMLVAEDDCLFRLADIEWTPAPRDPLSFARWAFDYPTPLSKFHLRLARHDGPLISKLNERYALDNRKSSFETLVFGQVVREPLCSIVIPLYKRYDFMHNQLLEMTADSFIREHCELIYVLDDPNMEDAIRFSAPAMLESYHLPFSVVVGSTNRGFAGASNLGASVAKAPYVLLLNSDVIPIEPGWLRPMIDEIATNEAVGVVGSRLLFANGAVQHDGMRFEWDVNWGCHLNKHPNSGMDPYKIDTPDVTAQHSVTAACLCIKACDFADVGGLDDQFLIGDFEDSDLCLKMRTLGKEVRCLHLNHLVHLERQSFSSLGTSSFRDKVARYNAWRHETRWGAVIKLLED